MDPAADSPVGTVYQAALALLMLLYVCGALAMRSAKQQSTLGAHSSPSHRRDAALPTAAATDDDRVKTGGFKSFQTNYLTVYAMVMFSDWLKGAYVYALYDSYGFSRKDIADLFVAGFMSSLVCGTYCGAIADAVGRRRMCLVFCVTYAASAATKIVPDYWVLMFGRILAGVATSLLTTSFEAWMVSEHNSRGYTPALLATTFATATQINGASAVLAGVASSYVAGLWGYAAPFLLALFPLCAVACVVTATWNENYGKRTAFSFQKSLEYFRKEPHLVYLGMAQSCFEAAMFTWVFLWTPALSTPETKASLPYGIIFASFMVCIMVGSLFFEAATFSNQVRSLPYVLHIAACVTSIIPIVLYESKAVVFLSFLAFEACCGVFFPLYGNLRAEYLPEDARASLSNFFRFPMNLLVVVVLLTGAQKTDYYGFVILLVMHLAGLAFFYRFDVLSRAGD